MQNDRQPSVISSDTHPDPRFVLPKDCHCERAGMRKHQCDIRPEFVVRRPMPEPYPLHAHTKLNGCTLGFLTCAWQLGDLALCRGCAREYRERHGYRIERLEEAESHGS
jgi:hypothetical protein